MLVSSDGQPPLDGQVVDVAAGDAGQVTLAGGAGFRTLGQLVVSAEALNPPPRMSWGRSP